MNLQTILTLVDGKWKDRFPSATSLTTKADGTWSLNYDNHEMIAFIHSHQQELIAAWVEMVENQKVDVRPEITEWLTGNRETNEAHNAALDDLKSTLQDSIQGV